MSVLGGSDGAFIVEVLLGMATTIHRLKRVSKGKWEMSGLGGAVAAGGGYYGGVCAGNGNMHPQRLKHLSKRLPNAKGR